MRILLSVSTGLILLSVIMTMQGAHIVISFASQYMAEWRNTTEHSAQHLAARIEQDKVLIEQLTTELTHIPGDPTIFLSSIRDRLLFFQQGLVWLNSKGQPVAWVPEQKPYNDLMPAVLTKSLPLPGHENRLSDILFTREGRPVVTFSARVDQQGTLLAVADLEAGLFRKMLPRTARGGHAALIDSQGWVLASVDEDIRYTRREHPDWVLDMMQEGRPTVSETNSSGKANDRHIMAFAPVGTVGWGMVLGEPIKEALAAPIELRRRMMLLGLAALILVVGYAWWDTGAMTRPLRRLTLLSKRIAAGDLSVPVAIERHDEIGALAQAFDAMRVSLLSSRQNLEHVLTETRYREEEVLVFYNVTQEILRSSDNESALRTVVERASRMLGGSSVAICLAESPDELLRCVIVSEQIGYNFRAQSQNCVAPHHSPTPLSCPLSQWGGNKEVYVKPVSREGATRGYLCVIAAPERFISEKDHALLAGLANLAGLALVHERLHEQSRTLAVYSERERISRELHDSVSQSLSYLYSQLELLKEILPKLSAKELNAELGSLADVASVAFEEARDSIFSLRIPGSGGEALPTVIIGCVRDFKARTGLAVELDTDAISSTVLTPEAEIQLVHIIQEALSNVAKHSRGSKVFLRAQVIDGELWISIQDNGNGFDPTAPRPGRRSFGLEMMRERAESVNGSLEIQASRTSGTRILVRIPLER